MYNSLNSQLFNRDNNNNFNCLENLNINQNTKENNKIQENIKTNINYISTIPNSEQYNMGYITNSGMFSTQNINNTDNNLINDLNYANNNKRNKSAYIKTKSKKIFYGVGSPIAQRWKNDNNVAKKIINNLEIKIDALNYENSLLKQNLGNITKYDKYNLYKKNLSFENRDQIENKFSTINQINEKMDMQKMDYKGSEDIAGIGGIRGNDALYKEIEQLKNEVTKLKESNQYLIANNIDLNKIIKNLRNNMNPTQNYINENIVIKEEVEENKNNKKINANTNINDKFDNKDNLNDNNNNNIKIIEEGINEQRKNININLNTDGSKYRINEDKFLQLLDINENLHKKLRNLLSICEEEIINYKPTSFENISKNVNNVNNIQKDFNNKNIYLNTIGNNIKELNTVNIERFQENNLSLEDLLNENALLKKKLKALNDAINEINSEQTIKLANFQEMLNESIELC